MEEDMKYIKQLRGCNLFVVGILTSYIAFRCIAYHTKSTVYYFLFLIIFLFLSFLSYKMKKWNDKKKMFLNNIIKFSCMSIFCYGSNDYYTILACSLVLFLILLESVILIDLADRDTRLLFLISVAVPLFLVGTVIFFYQKENLLLFKGVLLVCSMIIIYEVSELLAQNVISSEKAINKLKRLADDAIEANSELSKQQEKVNKANEKLAIQKIQLEVAYDKINQAAMESNTQNKISKYISSSLEMRTLLELITEAIQENLGLDTCAIFLLPDITGNDAVMYKIRGHMDEHSTDLMSREMVNGGFDSYIKSQKTYIDNNVEEGRYPFISGSELKSLIIVPLVENNVKYGALVCGKHESEYFNENVSFFENVVAQLLLAINNASLYSKMQQMAVVDGLTGLYNRGQLNRIFDHYEKQKSLSTPLTEAMIDIDHFKYVNDSYGHLFGDLVLKGVAKQARIIAKLYGGQAYRYGGEEFVILFQDKEITQCHGYMMQLQEMVNHLEFTWKNQIVSVHISVGIASYPKTCKSVSELLNATDGAMYYSKEHGRNRITIDSDSVRKFSRQAEGDS